MLALHADTQRIAGRVRETTEVLGNVATVAEEMAALAEQLEAMMTTVQL